jgi:DNA-3-methyladenine glycosylase II
LSARDPILGKLIREIEKGRLLSRGEPFQTLVRSIVGQQISVKVARFHLGTVPNGLSGLYTF